MVNQLQIGGSGILIVGDPEEVTEELIRWHEISGVDGFNFTYAVTPGSFEDLVEYVIPLLQEKVMLKKNIPLMKMVNLLLIEKVFMVLVMGFKT